MVEVVGIRQAYLESGLTAAEVARRLGWEYRQVETMYYHKQTGTRRPRRRAKVRYRPDASRVLRTLGLRPDSGGGYRTRIHSELAGVLCEALEVDPVDVGV